MPKYVVGFTGHFYIEAENQQEALDQIRDIGSTEPIPHDANIRLDYMDWVI